MRGTRPWMLLGGLAHLLLLQGCAEALEVKLRGLAPDTGDTGTATADLPDCPDYLDEPIPMADDAWWVDVGVDVEKHAACAVDREGGLTCFGSDAARGYQDHWPGIPLKAITIGLDACGIAKDTGQLVCWDQEGDDQWVGFSESGRPFIALDAVKYWYKPYPVTYWDCKALATDGTASYCRDPRGVAYSESTVFSTVHAVGEITDYAAGVTRAGFSYRVQVVPVSGVIDYDDLQLSEFWELGHDWESEVLLKVDCFVDRDYRPFCVVPPFPSHFPDSYEQPGDLWSASDCRWSRLDLREDAQWLEDDVPVLIGYRFDGVIEVIEASDVPLPPHRSLVPDGAYAKVVGLPDVAGCGITLDGELRCWDQEHVLDQDVPDVP